MLESLFLLGSFVGGVMVGLEIASDTMAEIVEEMNEEDDDEEE